MSRQGPVAEADNPHPSPKSEKASKQAEARRQQLFEKAEEKKSRMSLIDELRNHDELALDWKEKMSLLLNEKRSSHTAWLFSVIYSVMIVVSIFVQVYVNYLESRSVYSPMQLKFLEFIDVIFAIIFTIEAGLRIGIHRKPMSYIWSFYSIIDILAVLPYWLAFFDKHFGPASLKTDVWFHAIESSLPIFRMFKIMRWFDGGVLLIRSMSLSMEALPVPIFMLLIMVMIFGVLFHVIEPAVFDSVPYAMWFSIVTLSTVGYGDAAPESPAGKAATAFLIILGILYVAMPISIISASFSNVWENRFKILLIESIQDKFASNGIEPEDVIDIFKTVDRDQNGSIDFTELLDMIHGLGIWFKDEDMVELFMYLDADQSGVVDIVEFSKTLFPNLPAPYNYAKDAKFLTHGSSETQITERSSLLAPQDQIAVMPPEKQQSSFSRLSQVNKSKDEKDPSIARMEDEIHTMSQQIESLTTIMKQQQALLEATHQLLSASDSDQSQQINRRDPTTEDQDRLALV